MATIVRRRRAPPPLREERDSLDIVRILPEPPFDDELVADAPAMLPVVILSDRARTD
jgi:hypothetical protein